MSEEKEKISAAFSDVKITSEFFRARLLRLNFEGKNTLVEFEASPDARFSAGDYYLVKMLPEEKP